MPFCSQCGSEVQGADLFCSKCGARQPVAAPPRPAPAASPADIAAGISPKTASILCYVPWVGWIAAIIVLASNKFRRDRTVRFHAFQGLYLFVAWLFVQWVVKPMFWIPGGPHMPISMVLQLGLLALSIFMMIKASEDQVYSLPILGELAERSLAER
jgi:uncharacterized membrane protein